jgi:hypothetical protein
MAQANPDPDDADFPDLYAIPQMNADDFQVSPEQFHRMQDQAKRWLAQYGPGSQKVQDVLNAIITNTAAP